jgi:hypothetical protein
MAMVGGVDLQSQSSSESSSNPVPVNTAQSDWSLALSRMLGSLMQQQYAWGQQQFGKLDSLTDQQIDNFLRLGDVGEQMAKGLASRYDQTYAPMADRYAQEAETYASPQRMQHEMGRAQAGQMQAGKAALDNAERDLEAYGIDPSSGRYQDLVRASHTATAAAAAAAGEVERARVEQEGARRRENAMAYGQNIPSQAVNALNSAFSGVSGAVNAALGRANAGVALTQSAAPYGNAAMQVKLPPVGQQTVSQSRTESYPPQPSGGGMGGGVSRPSQSRGSPFPSQQMPQSGAGGYGAGGNFAERGAGPGGYQNPMGDAPAWNGQRGDGSIAQIIKGPGGDGALDGQWYRALGPNGAWYNQPASGWAGEATGRQGDFPWSGVGGTDNYNPYTGEFGRFGGADMNRFVNDPYGNTSFSDPNYNQTGAWGNTPFPGAQQPDYLQGMYDASQFDTSGYQNPYGQQQWDTGDPYLDAAQSSPWGQEFNDYYGGQQAPSWDQMNYDNSSDWYNPSYAGDYQGSTSGWETPASQVSNEGWSSPPSYDWGGADNWAQNQDWGDAGFAAGGPVIPEQGQGGGRVPPQMSPSGGRQIDDIPAVITQTGQQARLNSDEFVIPRDVALWKGQEFFQSLIKKSREARVGAPAKPSTQRPQGQNPGVR